MLEIFFLMYPFQVLFLRDIFISSNHKFLWTFETHFRPWLPNISNTHWQIKLTEYKYQCPASDFKSIHIKTIQVNIEIYLLTFRCYIATSSELSKTLKVSHILWTKACFLCSRRGTHSGVLMYIIHRTFCCILYQKYVSCDHFICFLFQILAQMWPPVTDLHGKFRHN